MGMKKVTVLPKHDSLSALLQRFNEFFVQIIVTIRQNMDQEDSTLSPSVPVGETVSSVTVPDLSIFTPATMQEVEKLITRSPAKSCGLDPVPTWLLKQHAECLVPIITSIVNMSLADGVFPDQFKTAHVCPLIKKSTLDCNVLKNSDPFLISRTYPKLWRRLLLPVCRSTSRTISYTSLCSQHTIRLTARRLLWFESPMISCMQ